MEVLLTEPQDFWSGFRCADVHTSINHRGVDADDGTGETAREFNRQVGFTACSRPHKKYGRAGCVHIHIKEGIVYLHDAEIT